MFVKVNNLILNLSNIISIKIDNDKVYIRTVNSPYEDYDLIIKFKDKNELRSFINQILNDFNIKEVV